MIDTIVSSFGLGVAAGIVLTDWSSRRQTRRDRSAGQQINAELRAFRDELGEQRGAKEDA